MKKKGILRTLGLCCLMGTLGCDSPVARELSSALDIVTGSEVPEEVREAACDEIYDAMIDTYGKPLRDPELAGYLGGVLTMVGDNVRIRSEVDKKARHALKFRVAVLDTDAPLSFGLPDGRILLGRGLLENVIQNEAQLSAVLAHECAHVLLEDVWNELQDSYSGEYWGRVAEDTLESGSISSVDAEKAGQESLEALGLDPRSGRGLTYRYKREQERRALEIAQDVLEELGFNVPDVTAMARFLYASESGALDHDPVHNISEKLLARLDERKFTPGRSGHEEYERNVLAILADDPD